MLVSPFKYLGTLLILVALFLLLFTRRHAAQFSRGQTEIEYDYGTSDQTVLGAGMTKFRNSVTYDKLSGDTPSGIEANWRATVRAKNLLQDVREFRASTQASYNEDSKKSVREALEDAELELRKLGRESFDTKKIVQGTQKLKVALKAAEELIARGPDPQTMAFKAAGGDKAAAGLDEALREAEEDGKSKGDADSLESCRELSLMQSSRSRRVVPISFERPPSKPSQRMPLRLVKLL